jgi:hypothetical protein
MLALPFTIILVIFDIWMGSRAKPDLSAARTSDRRCGDISLVILVFREKVPIKKEVQ